MNSDKLFSAMNYVEERFVAEADSIRPRATRHWLRVASMTACFFLLLTAAFTLFPGVRSDSAKESMKEGNSMYSHEYKPEVGEMETVSDLSGITDEAVQVAFEGLLQVISVHDGGFTASVERLTDGNALAAGEEVQVIYDENITVIENDGELVSCYRRAPTQEELPLGGVVKVRFVILEDGVLCVSQLGKEDAF